MKKKRRVLSAADRKLVAQAAELSTRRYAQNAGCRTDARSHAFMGKAIGESLRTIRRRGASFEHFVWKGKMAAYLLIENGHAPYAKSVPVQNWHLDFEPKIPAAKVWLRDRLRERRPHAAPNAEIHLRPDEMDFVRWFARSGFYVESIGLMGEVTPALRKLRAKHPRAFGPLPDGFSLRRLSTREEVEAIIRITRREFRARPEHGWFLKDPKFLKEQRKYLRSLLRPKPSRTTAAEIYVIYRGRRVVGQFGAYFDFRHPQWGRKVGIDLSLSREAQGHGLGLVAYATVLKSAARRQMTLFSGGTSHPVVLKLGREMGRWPFFILMKKGQGHYPLRHFGL